MRTVVVLYARRNTGMVVLSFLVAQGYDVRVVSDDDDVIWLADILNCPIFTLETIGKFDLFVCCHGNKIIQKQYLDKGTCINIHPCLYLYRGKDPVSRFIENKNTLGSVGVHHMTEVVDGGEVIVEEKFFTGEVNSYAEFYNIALKFYLVALQRVLKKLGYEDSSVY